MIRLSEYGRPYAVPSEASTIVGVDEHGAAWRSGMRAGDRLVAVDGRPARDLIDWMWLTSDLPVVVTVQRHGAMLDVTLDRAADEEVGISFADVVFDGIRTCDNACLFCFVSQLPPGLRPSLYVRDDDYRLSFLYGNFVTLTNLTDADVTRIDEQRLSPLYVSLHSTDPDVRESLVCATVEDTALQRVDELLACGIELHVQIVLVPGVNDGDVLQRTLSWLAEREGIRSVGVVPLGYTKAQSRFTQSYEDPASAAAVLDALTLWQEGMQRAREERWVHAADELYLAAGRALPPWDEYDGFPQFENGIGLARAFLDEFDEAVAEADGAGPGEDAPRVTLVTGELSAPLMRLAAPRMAALGVHADVLAVHNDFFGGNVSVTGLLTGHDLLKAIAEAPEADAFLLPDVVVNSAGLLLDDVPAEGLSAHTGREVRVVPTDAAGLVTEVQRIGSREEI